MITIYGVRSAYSAEVILWFENKKEAEDHCNECNTEHPGLEHRVVSSRLKKSS